MERAIYLGWDPREATAYQVAQHSAVRHLTRHVPVHGLVLADLIARGLYTRPLEYRQGPELNPLMWDVISQATMATQHANARFLVKELARSGWALFMDGDVLVRADLNELFDGLDPAKALYCVQHAFDPPPGVKMDGQIQSPYSRKNWSSVMCLQVDHPANRALTLDLINSVPGRDLHRFCWLEDDLIGALDPAWNWLVNAQPQPAEVKVAHFTLGLPDMPGYETQPYADEWRAEQRRWAA